MRGGGVLGMEHELDDSRPVADVDEDQTAVVAAAVHPPGDARLRVRTVGGQLAAPGVAVAVRTRRVLHAVLAVSVPRIAVITSASSVSCCSPDCMFRSVATPLSPTIAT